MRAKGLVISHRMIWFGIPLLCLSLLLCGQTFRLMFWTQRRDRHAEALEFSGSDIDVKLVERLTPTFVRLMLFVPPGRHVAALPVIHTENGPVPAVTYPTLFQTTDEAGRVQIMCRLYSGEETTRDWLHYAYLEHFGISITPEIPDRGFRLPAKNLGLKVDPRLEEGLIADREGKYFLPLFINDHGQSLGLELTDASDSL